MKGITSTQFHVNRPGPGGGGPRTPSTDNANKKSSVSALLNGFLKRYHSVCHSEGVFEIRTPAGIGTGEWEMSCDLSSQTTEVEGSPGNRFTNRSRSTISSLTTPPGRVILFRQWRTMTTKGDPAMSDADGRLIPLVEDDQGEGIKDFLDEFANVPSGFDKIMENFYGKGKADSSGTNE